MKKIKKILKKWRLIKKYTRTDRQMENDIYLVRLMKDDKDFLQFFYHKIGCELRCLARLKKL